MSKMSRQSTRKNEMPNQITLLQNEFKSKVHRLFCVFVNDISSQQKLNGFGSYRREEKFSAKFKSAVFWQVFPRCDNSNCPNAATFLNKSAPNLKRVKQQTFSEYACFKSALFWQFFPRCDNLNCPNAATFLNKNAPNLKRIKQHTFSIV